MHCGPEGIELTKQELKALIEHSSKDETRFHLNAVLFELGDNEVRAVATDGHRMVLAAGARRRHTNDFPTTLIPRASLVQASKALSRKSHRLLIVITGANTVSLVAVDPDVRHLSTSEVEPIKAAYPPYETVIPAHTDEGQSAGHCGAFGLNAHYVASMSLVAKAVDSTEGRGEQCVMLPPPDDYTPCVLLAGRETRWTVVVMPMRGDVGERKFGAHEAIINLRVAK